MTLVNLGVHATASLWILVSNATWKEGWSQKLGELLIRYDIDLDRFVIATREKHMDFSVQAGKLHYGHDCCPKIHQVLEVIADLIPE